jgi:hypothetical protein
MKKTYLISYPRSGNTWLRYCVEFITQRPTIGYQSETASSYDKYSIGKFSNLNTNLNSEPVLIKRHGFESIMNEKSDKIVVLIRNYQEVIIRHSEKIDFDSFTSNLIGKNNEVDYYSIVNQYDKWNGEKIIIYYEDLITNLEGTLKKVMSFISNEDFSQRISYIINNLEHHKKESIRIYSIHSESKTQGNETKYHSNKISKAEKAKREEFVKNKDLKIFEKILKRYEI